MEPGLSKPEMGRIPAIAAERVAKTRGLPEKIH